MGAMGKWRSALVLLLTLVLASCSHVRETPGPAVADPGGGGIGGTGAPPETVGVFGTVRGFGSVLVNGLRVPTPRDGVILTPFGPRPADGLAPGHVVEATIEARESGWQTRRMAQLLALQGPLEAVSVAGRQLTVMGVAVTVPEGIPVAVEGGLGGLAPGMRVAVSGLWRDGGLVASRLEPALTPTEAAGGGAVVSGPVRIADDGAKSIGPLEIAGHAADGLSGAGFAVVRGRYAAGRLQARQVQAGHPALAGPLGRLSVEAYRGQEDGRPALHGVGLRLVEPVRLDRLPGQRGVFIGALRDGFAIEHGVALPEGWSAQAAVLEALGDGLQPRRGAIDLR